MNWIKGRNPAKTGDYIAALDSGEVVCGCFIVGMGWDWFGETAADENATVEMWMEFPAHPTRKPKEPA